MLHPVTYVAIGAAAGILLGYGYGKYEDEINEFMEDEGAQILADIIVKLFAIPIVSNINTGGFAADFQSDGRRTRNHYRGRLDNHSGNRQRPRSEGPRAHGDLPLGLRNRRYGRKVRQTVDQRRRQHFSHERYPEISGSPECTWVGLEHVQDPPAQEVEVTRL